MLGSPNLRRGNAPLAMRLRVDDLRAQLAPLDRYGVGGMSFAMSGGVRALGRRRQRRVARRFLVPGRRPRLRGRLTAPLTSPI